MRMSQHYRTRCIQTEIHNVGMPTKLNKPVRAQKKTQECCRHPQMEMKRHYSAICPQSAPIAV